MYRQIVFLPKEFDSKKEYEEAILYKLKEKKIDLIVLAGYMRIIGPVLLENYDKRIINIHPSLLPAFLVCMAFVMHLKLE